MSVDALISRTIGSLINGVSQQPFTVRLPSQAEVQDNCISRIVDGVSRRPPTEHIDKLTATASPAGGYFIHVIDRSDSERYIVLVEDSDIRVFDFAGTEATVTKVGGSGAYLNIDTGAGEEALSSFAAVSVADTTLVVNRNTAVAMEGNADADRPNEFLLHVTADTFPGGTGVIFTFTIGATTQTSTTSDTRAEIHVDNILTNALNGTNYPNWTFTKIGDTVIHAEQTSNTGSPEAVTMSNNWGDRDYSFAHKTIQRFSDLPARGKDGFTVEVVGTDGDEETNYWVKYDAEAELWKETVKPGLDNDFDATTLPHLLVRTGVSPLTFDFKVATWDNRLKGSETTAPEPSFVGKKIRDLVFHRDRLCFVADEELIMSEAGNFFNFWPTTVTTVVDADVIDISGTNNKIAIADFVVPFDGTLTVFSADANVQNELQAGDTLSQKTARLVERGRFALSEAVRPLAGGQALYLVVDRDTASGVWEYTIGANERAQADEITTHVQTYIPGTVRAASISPLENILVLQPETETNALYVYSYFFVGNDKAQSSWSRWTFGVNDTILAVEWLNEQLWLVIERSDGVHLERLDVRKLTDGGFQHRVHYDSKVELTGVYSGATGLTTWTLPYNQLSGGTFEIVLSDAGWGTDLGRVLTGADFTTASTAKVAGDWSAHPVSIGRKYTSDYEFSPPVLDEGDARSASPVTQGRLQLRWMKVLYRKTGAFTAKVEFRDESGLAYEYPFTATIGLTPIGATPLKDGDFRFMVGTENDNAKISIESDSYLPFTLVGAEWEAYYSARANRA